MLPELSSLKSLPLVTVLGVPTKISVSVNVPITQMFPPESKSKSTIVLGKVFAMTIAPTLLNFAILSTLPERSTAYNKLSGPNLLVTTV